MKNKKPFYIELLMRISTFMLIAAIIFDHVSWLPQVAGVSMAVSSILAIIDNYRNKEHFVKSLLNIVLIVSSIYLIIEY